MRIVIALLAATTESADVVEAKCSLARNKKYCDEQDELYQRWANKTGIGSKFYPNKGHQGPLLFSLEYCKPTFNLDILFCQPLTPSNTVINVPCPEYIPRRKYLDGKSTWL